MTRTYNAITSDERKIALNTLRAAMLSLKPTGATGFEGLLAKILSDFLNQPVRLFKSGYQFGQDAATSSPDTILSIEGKRYSDSISDGTLLEKLPQLMDQENSPHLWLAGVTSETNPRLEKTVRSFSEQTGIACFILDWPALSESPPLVAYCMLEPNALREFLQEHAKTDDDQSAIAAAIDTLSRCDTLCAASKELSAELTAPSIGLALAKQGNALWLQEKLSSQEQARAAFGQRLAPAATSALPLQNRAQLEANIIHRVFSTGPGAPVFVVGKQGFGKSWAVVNAWSNAPEPPLLLVLTANNAADLEKATDISDALAREFLVQTGEIFPELGLPRWKRRFARWRRHPSPETARFVILLDGLNQRADAGWTKILSALQDFAVRTGGQLAITVRPPLYKRLKNLVPEHRSPICPFSNG